MLSNLGKYLFGESATPTDEKTADETQASLQKDFDFREGDLGWVLVDHSPKKECADEERGPISDSSTCASCSSDISDLPEVASRGCGREDQGDGALGSLTPSDSESHDGHGDFMLFERSAFGPRLRTWLGESWIVTPPPCFTGTDRVLHDLEVNPLENLLIEYPSIEFLNPARMSSTAQLADRQDIAEPQRGVVLVAAHEAVSGHVAARRQRMVISESQENVILRAGRRDQRKAMSKPMSRKNLERINKVYMVRSCGRKHAAARDRVLRPSCRMNSRHTQRH